MGARATDGRWGAPTGMCGRESWTARATTPGARVSGESTPALDTYLPRHALDELGVPLAMTLEHAFAFVKGWDED